MRAIKFIPFFLLLQQFAVAQQFRYNNITTSQGLPSSQVYAILEDARGYMWFATDHGVARYNGKEFTIYTTAEGLLDNTVFRMCEDKKGRIWFASQSNELCYWQNDSIYKTPASTAIHLKIYPRDYIKTIYVDSSDNLWVNSNISTFVSEAKNNYSEFKNYTFDSKSNVQLISVEGKVGMTDLVRHQAKAYISDNEYTLTVNCHEHNSPARYHRIDLDFDLGRLICAYSKGTYLVGMENALLVISNDKKIQKIHLPKRVINVITDRNNGIWIGFYKGGIAYYKDGDLNRAPVMLLDGVSVDDVCLDHEDGVWIATLEKGVFYMPSLSILEYSNVPFLNDHITFLGTLNDEVVACTYGNMVCKEVNKKFMPIDYLNRFGKNLYYITSIRDTTYASFENVLLRFVSSSTIPLQNKQGNYRFAAGKMVFSTEDCQVWLQSGGSLTKINNITGGAEFFGSPFRATCALPLGNDVLVGGKKGLFEFKKNKYFSLGALDKLLNSQIISMVKDKDSTIWIATIGNGVLKFKNKKVIQINEKKGLISNICTAISIDQYGNIWVGTNKGVSCIQQPYKDKNWHIKNIDERNGLNSNDVSKVLAFKNSVWVGTISGLSCININEILRPIPPSCIYISSVKMNNKDSDTSKKIWPYNENNLKLKLDALTFKDNGNHLYRYRLIGLDSSWHETNTDELSFNNLTPGNYRFHAQVANSDKIWSKNVATYSFVITKPFWLTWWFILLELIFIGSISYSIIMYRINIIKKKEQEKLRINKLLAEYQMKALTAQMNPHFIFNAINSIQNFIIQNHSVLAYDYLIKFSKLIRLVLNNSKANEISLQQELETLSLYIELEQLRFENAFEYQLKIEPGLNIESLMIPALLLQPYIENAIWHGLMPLKKCKGVITLTIIEHNNLLKITITDNGVGRKASDIIKKKIRPASHQSVGMELTGKRIELFGKDTQFLVQIIDNYDDSNEPAGTVVEIILPMVEMY